MDGKSLLRLTYLILVLAAVGCHARDDRVNRPAAVDLGGFSAPAEIATGAVVTIPYTLEEGEGILDFYADGDGDLDTTDDQVVIAKDVPAGSGSVEWDTSTSPPGDYRIVVRGTDGDEETVTVSDVTVSVNGPPVIDILRPAGDDVVSSGNTYRVEYAVDDPDDDALTSVYVDGDGDLSTTTDLYTVVTNVADADGATQAAEWDTTGVPLGSYFVVVESRDTLNGTVTETASGRIEVIENVSSVEVVKGTSGTIVYDLRTGSDDSVLIAGAGGANAVFGAGEPNETKLGAGGVFVARYAPDGTLDWVAEGTGSSSGALSGDSFSDGSCVISGLYEASVVFGKGETNETMLTGVAGSTGAFVARYNADGTLAWAHGVSDPAGHAAGDRAVARSDGSTVWGGRFQGTVTFGVGESNETTSSAAGDHDAFVARHAVDGSLLWARTWGSTGYNGVGGIDEMPDGSILVSGGFSGTVTFGAGEANEMTLTAAGETDVFLARLEGDGTLLWARRYGGTRTDFGRSPIVRSDGRIALAGYFAGTVDFGSETLTSAGGLDVFVAAFDGDGNALLAGSFGGPGDEFPNRVTVGTDDAIAVTGQFTTPFTVGLTSLGSQGGIEVLTAVFEADGTLRWARSDGGPADDNGLGIAFRNDGTLLVSGRFGYRTGSGVTFGKGEAGETVVPAPGTGSASFIVRINRDGKF